MARGSMVRVFPVKLWGFLHGPKSVTSARPKRVRRRVLESMGPEANSCLPRNSLVSTRCLSTCWLSFLL